MMNEIDERIIRFYDQEMSEEESNRFLSDLELDADLKIQWEFYGRLIEGIKSEGALELKEYIKDHVKTEEIKEQSNIWMYAAASVTFLLLSYFAIYSYLETGNIKDAAEIITLKDEKSDKFKFWKTDKSKTVRTVKDSAKYYKDSLLALEQSRNLKDTMEESPIAALVEAEDNYDKSELTAYSFGDATSPSTEEITVESSVALTQVNLVPIKLTPIIPVENKDAANVYENKGKRLNPKITSSKKNSESLRGRIKEEINTGPNTVVKTIDSTLSKSKSEIKRAIVKFKLQHFEDADGNARIELKHGTIKDELQILLYNIWGSNPLVYEVAGVYYLDMGENGPWQEKGGSGVWKIPHETGNYEKIEWVKNKTLIEQIRN